MNSAVKRGQFRKFRRFKKYLDWRRIGGITVGNLKLVKRRQMLFISYGLAEFDGCGGRDHAIETDVLGAPALLLQSAEARWSQLLWPVRDS